MKFVFEKERMTARTDDGVLMGSITFPRVRAGLVNITAVTVFPGFRGQGVEDAMMEAVLEHLEAQGVKTALTCPFAQQYVEKNPRWKKILPGEMHFTKY